MKFVVLAPIHKQNCASYIGAWFATPQFQILMIIRATMPFSPGEKNGV